MVSNSKKQKINIKSCYICDKLKKKLFERIIQKIYKKVLTHDL